MLSSALSKDGNNSVPKSEIEVLFPEIVQGKINTEEFLTAARGIVRILGTYNIRV